MNKIIYINKVLRVYSFDCIFTL